MMGPELHDSSPKPGSQATTSDVVLKIGEKLLKTKISEQVRRCKNCSCDCSRKLLSLQSELDSYKEKTIIFQQYASKLRQVITTLKQPSQKFTKSSQVDFPSVAVQSTQTVQVPVVQKTANKSPSNTAPVRNNNVTEQPVTNGAGPKDKQPTLYNTFGAGQRLNGYINATNQSTSRSNAQLEQRKTVSRPTAPKRHQSQPLAAPPAKRAAPDTDDVVVLSDSDDDERPPVPEPPPPLQPAPSSSLPQLSTAPSFPPYNPALINPSCVVFKVTKLEQGGYQLSWSLSNTSSRPMSKFELWFVDSNGQTDWSLVKDLPVNADAPMTCVVSPSQGKRGMFWFAVRGEDQTGRFTKFSPPRLLSM